MEGWNNEDGTVYDMGIEHELRFVVSENATDVTLEMLSGYAEIFGSELEQNKVYNFPPSTSVAVFTWLGCSVKLCGNTEAAYMTSKNLMIIPVSLHASLESLRIKAERENARGPISLVVGPVDVGKSSFCRTLLNYAARLGRRPLYIDLDVGQSSTSIPGTISILSVDKPSDIIEGFSQQATSAYPFGKKSPGENIALYFLLIKKLGQLTQTRLKNANQNTRSSGIIIDTCGWVRGHGYNAISLAACAFEIDILFVIEEETLYLQLRKDMPSSVKVVYVPKQEGVYRRQTDLRKQNRENRVWEYFYGSRVPLNPHVFDVKFSDIEIYEVKQSKPDDCVDIRNISTEDVKIVSVQFSPKLVNYILGLSFANSINENLIMTNIIGFVCITDVDMTRKLVTVLSPQPAPLPSRILLMGGIQLTKNY